MDFLHVVQNLKTLGEMLGLLGMFGKHQHIGGRCLQNKLRHLTETCLFLEWWDVTGLAETEITVNLKKTQVQEKIASQLAGCTS